MASVFDNHEVKIRIEQLNAQLDYANKLLREAVARGRRHDLAARRLEAHLRKLLREEREESNEDTGRMI